VNFLCSVLIAAHDEEKEWGRTLSPKLVTANTQSPGTESGIVMQTVTMNRTKTGALGNPRLSTNPLSHDEDNNDDDKKKNWINISNPIGLHCLLRG
jgi:hypothetical protein